MTDLPVPKYKMGQTVWLGYAESIEGRHRCPDCFGSKVWAVKSPAGLETTSPCPRCTRDGYFRSDENIPSLSYQDFQPRARALTIGSITAKTHPYQNDDGVEYMCCETGVGSGSIYRESRLHATEAEALEAARIEAADRQTAHDEKPEELKKYVYSGFTCDLAAYSLSWNTLYHSWDSARDYREVADRIAENGGKATSEDIEDLLACREEKSWRRKHPLAAVIDAVKAGDIDAARAAYDAIPKPARITTPVEAEPA